MNHALTLWIWILIATLPSVGCTRLSDHIEDETAGMNGGFEHVRAGLPVNWLVYSPSTIPTGDYDLVMDTQDFKEGRQSLKFLVRECSSTGGWHSPGIAQEYPAEPGASYRVSFWIKNEGCEYEVGVHAVDAKTGRDVTVDSSREPGGSWRHVEHVFTVPPPYEVLRFGLSIRSPGSLWIDDVKIERVAERIADADSLRSL